MILFRIQRHPSKPETERDGLEFIFLGTVLEKTPCFFYSLPGMQSWNLDNRESDIFRVLEEVLVDVLCIFDPIFNCGIVIDICS